MRFCATSLPVRSSARLAFALPAFALGVAAATPARADASGWAFLGGGAVAWKQAEGVPIVYQRDPKNRQNFAIPLVPLTTAVPATKPDFGTQGALTFDIGVGTSPEAPLIFGGIFRLMPYIGWGTDLAILGRVATRGYQQGDFGLALDAGGYARFWGSQSSGFLGELVLGAPLGFELRLVGSRGTNDALSYGAIAGVDILRLTVFRRALLDWWQNPSPTLRSNEALTTPGMRF